MAVKLVFLNRRFVSENQAAFSVFDRGLLYGDGLFETMRIYSGKFFRLGAHVKRLFRGLRELGIKIPFSQAELEIFTRELTLSNRIHDGFARIVVSRGEGFLGFSPRGATDPHVAICARERPVQLRRKEAWRVVIHDHAITPMPLKSLSYLPHVLAKKAAEDAGFEDAILVDGKGNILEATSSNVFLWNDRQLTTPPLSTGCLPGITREEVIKVARQKGFRVVEKAFKARDCKKAEGMFLTNSLLEIVPCHLDRKMNSGVLAQLNDFEAEFAYYRSNACR